jgi:hypothetical protein
MRAADLIDISSGARQLCRFASHSLSLGHFFFARLSVQSPQMVMSGLHGTKPSELCTFSAFLIFAFRAFSMLDTFDMAKYFYDPGLPRRAAPTTFIPPAPSVYECPARVQGEFRIPSIQPVVWCFLRDHHVVHV